LFELVSVDVEPKPTRKGFAGVALGRSVCLKVSSERIAKTKRRQVAFGPGIRFIVAFAIGHERRRPSD
jgi:hypothetical protein